MEKDNCMDCGAVGATCCSTAQVRLEIANSLAVLVDRQAQEITRMKDRLIERAQVVAALRLKLYHAEAS